MNWNNDWYKDSMPEVEYLKMATYIYTHYNWITKIMPFGKLDKLKLFVETGSCSDIEYATFLNASGIIANREIGKRIYHWLTCEVLE